jgi:hypothetical protein
MTATITHQDEMAGYIETLTTKGHTKAEKEEAMRGIIEIAHIVDKHLEPQRQRAKQSGKMFIAPTWDYAARLYIQTIMRRAKRYRDYQHSAKCELRKVAEMADELQTVE